MRGNRPRIGRIVVARGRDAADGAISTSFGRTKLAQFKVLTEELLEMRLRRMEGFGRSPKQTYRTAPLIIR
jgi:hypothetical protein